LQRFAEPAYLGRFLFSGLQGVAVDCVLGDVEVM
jgi:hypothetical protein